MGFVGSTGKAAKPIPCSVDEYERLINDAAAAEYAARIAAGETAIKKEVKVVKQPEPKPVLKEAPVKVGQDVEILNGTFAGEKCKVIAINLEKQTVKVEYDLFGRTNAFEVGFDDVKLAK